MVQKLGQYKADLELCKRSPDFQKLPRNEFKYWVIHIDSSINHVSDKLHDSPSGRLLFVAFNIAYGQHSALLLLQNRKPRLPDDHRNMSTRDDANAIADPCNKNALKATELKITTISLSVQKYLKKMRTAPSQ
jgi:hypothetical protein